MHHWSKAKAAKLENFNFINTIEGIKLIKFIYTCRSQVGKKKPSLDKSYTITSKNNSMTTLIWRGRIFITNASLIRARGYQHWKATLNYNVTTSCHAEKIYSLQFTTHTLHLKKVDTHTMATMLILYIKGTVSVSLCGQCLEDSSSHCPFPVVSICLWWQTGQGG